MDYWTELKYLVFFMSAAQVIQTIILLFMYKQIAHFVRMEIRRNRMSSVIKTAMKTAMGKK